MQSTFSAFLLGSISCHCRVPSATLTSAILTRPLLYASLSALAVLCSQFSLLGNHLVFWVFFRGVGAYFWFFSLATAWHVGSYFPNQGLNSHPLHRMLRVLSKLNHQASPSSLFIYSFHVHIHTHTHTHTSISHQGSPWNPLVSRKHLK